MSHLYEQQKTRERRKLRSRIAIQGTAVRPRISIFKSNQFLYAQLIDDDAMKTLVSASTREIKEKAPRTKQAAILGKKVSELAKKAGIEKAILHKGGYKYHGHIKAFTEAAREAGLTI